MKFKFKKFLFPAIAIALIVNANYNKKSKNNIGYIEKSYISQYEAEIACNEYSYDERINKRDSSISSAVCNVAELLSNINLLETKIVLKNYKGNESKCKKEEDKIRIIIGLKKNKDREIGYQYDRIHQPSQVRKCIRFGKVRSDK